MAALRILIFKFLVLIVGCTIAVSMSGCENKAQAPTGESIMGDILIFQKDNGKSFIVRPGAKIEIQLIDNPTTGYRWTPSEFDEQIINLQETDFETAAEGGVGAGGVRTFTFLAESPGTVKIEFLLGRVWESKDAAKDRYEVTIHVQE